MYSEFIEPGDERWERVFDCTDHDFYHLPEYIKLSSTHEDATPCAYYFDNGQCQVLIPLLIRKLPPELHAPSAWHDATSPYGYPSPVITNPEDHASIEEAFAEFIQTGTRQCIISAFLRLHPLIPFPAEVLSRFGKLVNHGKTVYIDLSATEEELASQVRKDHRKDIRRLKRNNFFVTQDEWDQYDEFVRLYYDNMNAVGAADFYFFSKKYFKDLKNSLSGKIHLFSVISDKGEIAASGLFIEHERFLGTHLTASSKKYFKMAPTKLLNHDVSKWAKKSGLRYHHLGGGLSGKMDSLFKFKSGFSSLTADFYTMRIVMDESKYNSMSAESARAGFSTSDNVSDFFPIYRSSITV